jgi:hypothetical protein
MSAPFSGGSNAVDVGPRPSFLGVGLREVRIAAFAQAAGIVAFAAAAVVYGLLAAPPLSQIQPALTPPASEASPPIITLPTIPDVISTKPAPPSPSPEAGAQVAMAGDDVEIVRDLLANKINRPDPLNRFIESHGLPLRYPGGFVLFYSNGENSLYSKHFASSTYFDPSTIVVDARTPNLFCLSGFRMEIHGSSTSIDHSCFGVSPGTSLTLQRIGRAGIVFQSLGRNSDLGAAWVIGIADMGRR